MSRSALEQLREVNPHHETLAAPPIQTIRGRLGERPRHGASRATVRTRRGPALGLALPLITSAIAVAVLIFVLTSLHAVDGRSNSGLGSASHPVHVTTSGPSAAPRDGMRGSVYLFDGTALAADGSGMVSLQQCLGCNRDGNQTPGSRVVDWLLTTDRAGSGTLVKTPYLLTSPQLSGPNGWASGVQSSGHGAGGAAEFFVTHDAGRHWSIAPSAAPNYGNQQLSLGSGEVWTVGQPGTATVVLHAAASASRLLATAAQPTHQMWPNAQILAAGPGMAYITSGGGASGAAYVTRDDGRSWRQLTRPCPTGEVGSLARAAFGDAVWAVCERVPTRTAPLPRNAHMTLARSTDGGGHWSDLRTPFPADEVPIVSPVSASVLWAETGSGAILRSTDGGSTWQTVWSLAQQVPGLQSSHVLGTYPGDLIAQGPATATMQLSLIHGRNPATRYTNLVRYRTTDGGRTWKATVVSLATR